MPNYCYNTLEIEGDQKELIKFKEFAKGKIRYEEDVRVLDFNSFIPYPKDWAEQDELVWKYRDLCMKEQKKELTQKEREELALMRIQYSPQELDKDGYNQGGYDWCCRCWGTKWNACSPSLFEDEGKLGYEFDSAWSPPIPVIVAMSNKFPKLYFSLNYKEEGMGFEGDFEVKAGEILNDDQREYREEENEN